MKKIKIFWFSFKILIFPLLLYRREAAYAAGLRLMGLYICAQHERHLRHDSMAILHNFITDQAGYIFLKDKF